MTPHDLDQVLADTPIAELPAFIGYLAQLQAQAHVRLLSQHATPEPRVSGEAGRYLTVEEVCQRYSVTPKWLYRHKKQLPHSQPSRKVLLFPEQAITRWFASRKGT